MSKPTPLPCPSCNGLVSIFASSGGAGGNLTDYDAECKPCGILVPCLGSDGTMRSAIRDWNRWVKAAKADPKEIEQARQAAKRRGWGGGYA